ncbi:DUF3783 domain-containing protein [Oribacterium sp. FC2011]|uniref:DUF3783 domain-containing protein n=1 Tax=Oribacterium sp. FC2011 TaxID=1408311 RepID=UPI0004E17BB0|nr:DUF3783 domain-containing protein [Oribacterium sp. FC2011]
MMKSIIYINKKSKDKVTKVKSIALLKKIKLESVSEEEYSSLPEDAEILIMRGMDRVSMTDFLSALRKKGLSVDYKCVETESNKDWPIDKLYKEIKGEHEAMQRQRTD